MFCSQIAPWHGPNPKQIEPWTVWEKWIILLDKLFLEDNEVLQVKQDLRKKKFNFFCISEGLLTSLKFVIWVKRGMKYDT